jgi:hypothetical protein
MVHERELAEAIANFIFGGIAAKMPEPKHLVVVRVVRMIGCE